jgi:hypothetical protein
MTAGTADASRGQRPTPEGTRMAGANVITRMACGSSGPRMALRTFNRPGRHRPRRAREPRGHGHRPAWWLVAVVLGTLIVVAGLTAIPARIGARSPVAEILQAETA